MTSERELPGPGRRDAGFTLPELLVSIIVTGILVAAMSMAAILVIRQTDNNQGRLNNTRAEQSVGIWMPSDLASAEDVNTDPAASPCGAQCPPGLLGEGSNALMLSWTGSEPGATDAIVTITTVAYRYERTGDEFSIVRIECLSVGGGAPECTKHTLLHDVMPPPAGTPWEPGVTSPTWVMLVGLALDPAAVDEAGANADPTYQPKVGRRVTVTINGGGDAAGGGGGQEVITLSAGGTTRQASLSTNALADSPTFSATRSRCGGAFGMLVDTSGSIGSTNMTNVRTGISQFVDAFAGTPIKLQVVRFSSTASTLGAGSGWSRYYDMLVEADVADLKAQVGTLSSSGSTNWEDALFRMFKNQNGTVQEVLPDTLIFFTDGMPTYNRLNASSSPVAPVANTDDSGLPAAAGTTYNQLSWNRANRIAREYDADVERFIGVFVGSDTAGTSNWLTAGPGYHLTDFQRGYHYLYEQGFHYTDWQRGYHLNYEYAGTGMIYEKRSGTSWVSTNRSQYNIYNTVAGDTDGWRTRVTSTLGSWTATTVDVYNKSNLTSDSTDGWRTVVDYTSPYTTWTATTEESFNAGNTTTDATDGWDATKVYSAPYNSWLAVTASVFDAGNTTADDTDGWRQSVQYSAPYDLWTGATESAYLAGNTVWGNADGWIATKVYSLPYTYYEAATSTATANTTILSRIVTVGTPVPASPPGGPYENAAVADMYVLPNWSEFAGALNSVALAECGGTVTVQTRVGSAAAADPFTYQNSVDLKVATTSSLYRSGTFDYDLSGGASVQATITPLNLSELTHYEPVSWSCKSSGVAIPFTTTPISGTIWSKVSLTVAPNMAISCIQTVRLK